MKLRAPFIENEVGIFKVPLKVDGNNILKGNEYYPIFIPSLNFARTNYSLNVYRF